MRASCRVQGFGSTPGKKTEIRKNACQTGIRMIKCAPLVTHTVTQTGG